MEMFRYKDHKNKSGWSKAPKKELKTIIDSGTLNNKERTTSNDAMVSTTEVNKIKLDQDGNVDKIKVSICVKGDLQKKMNQPWKIHTHQLHRREGTNYCNNRRFQTQIKDIST
jgi:hypothetical protein